MAETPEFTQYTPMSKTPDFTHDVVVEIRDLMKQLIAKLDEATKGS